MKHSPPYLRQAKQTFNQIWIEKVSDGTNRGVWMYGAIQAPYLGLMQHGSFSTTQRVQ